MIEFRYYINKKLKLIYNYLTNTMIVKILLSHRRVGKGCQSYSHTPCLPFSAITILLFISIALNAIHMNLDQKQLNQTSNDFITTLYEKFDEFRKAIEKFVNKRLDPVTRFKIFAVNTFKSYTVVEPTVIETLVADRAMDLMFGLSSGLLPDSNESMNTFCEYLLTNLMKN